MEHTNSGRVVVAVVGDLIFGSRIRAAAQHAGARATFVRTPADLLAQAPSADLILLDLDTRWLDAPTMIRSIRDDPAAASAQVVAFGPHVDADALTAARDAGADRVLARSAFVKLLPDLLRK
ncbi:MAG TPA: hypothetical protein VHG09_07360 [Longimicrobiales bacterium]|nr:hypothetical protein [Longimicrobiales bacterium]